MFQFFKSLRFFLCFFVKSCFAHPHVLTNCTFANFTRYFNLPSCNLFCLPYALHNYQNIQVVSFCVVDHEMCY